MMNSIVKIIQTCFAILLAAGIASTIKLEAAESKSALPPSGIENFEMESVPPGWRVSDGAVIKVVGERFKSGAKSLFWSWDKEGATLTCSWPAGFAGVEVPYNNPSYPGHTLALWVYNETPMPRILRLEILRGEEVIGKSWYVLNFKGWRPLGAPYREVLINSVQQAVTGFRLIAPKGVGTGRLYLDYVNPKCKDILYSDNQQPWVGNPEILNTGKPERYIYLTEDISRNRPWLATLKPVGEITEEERKDMATILDRCLTVDKAASQAKPLIETVLPKDVPTALDDFGKTLKIRRSPEGIITGVPLLPAMYWGGWQFNSPPDGVVGGGQALGSLIQAYLFEKGKGNTEQAAKLLSACFDALDHMLDQGYSEGNYNVGCGGVNFRFVMTLRKEMEETGRLRDHLLAAAACGFQSRGGDALLREDWAKVGYCPRNTDTIGDYNFILVLLALLPNESERLQRLHAWSRAMSCLCDPAIGAPYSWDGGGQHHMKFHTAYSGSVMMKQAYWVRGTLFSLSPAAIASLKQAYMIYAFMTPPDGFIPPNISGYTGCPQKSWEWLAKNLMTPLDTQETRKGADSDVAGVWVRHDGVKSDSPPATPETFQEKLARKEPFNGHMTMNGAAIALHRRSDWLVSIVGQFKFRRGPEANGGYIASVYNYYSCNGSVFVTASGTPVSTWDSGYSLEGWDSRLYPGTTSYLGETENELYSKMEGVGGLGGGTDMDGDGVWGVDFIRGDMLFKKSAFCFGDRVTMITTDLLPKKKLPMVTTLFQNVFGSGGDSEVTKGKINNSREKMQVPVPPEQEPCWADGAEIAEFPYDNTLASGKASWLVDNKRTGYYVHPECPPLHLTRREQSWTYPYWLWLKPGVKDPKGDHLRPGGTDSNNYIPSSANFATAWFEHGDKPEETSCVYSLFPQSSPELMRKFSDQLSVNSDQSGKEPPYRIIQKDSKAHILWDRDSNSTGFIIFDKEWAPLKEVISRQPALSSTEQSRSSKSNGSSVVSDKKSSVISGKNTDNCSLITDNYLLKVNRPCYVMVKEHPEGSLKISVASTDLDGWPPEEVVKGKGSRILLSGDVELTLQGSWAIQDVNATTPRECRATTEGGNTKLIIPYTDFMPVRIALRPAKSFWERLF